MLAKRLVELMVGVMMIFGMIALLVLALKVSGLTTYTKNDYYHVTAAFDNIGSLKVRAPVTIAGVRVGEVDHISLNPKTFRARVGLLIDKHENNLPVDSSASILTAGLLGANYISISPGYEEKVLVNGSKINDTHPALILEHLIGQFLFKTSKSK